MKKEIPWRRKGSARGEGMKAIPQARGRLSEGLLRLGKFIREGRAGHEQGHGG